MVRVGFIGTGGMGMGQARAFSKVRGCRLQACADPSEESRQAFTREFPEAAVYDDHRKLLQNPDVDVVVVAVPTALHSSISIDALRARKPTLVEKPMARTTAQCRRMIEVARRYRILLMVAHCRRFDPSFCAMVKAIREGKLGRPMIWRSAMAVMGPGGWFMDEKVGGGPFLDGGVHNYDTANQMFGDPQRVTGSVVNFDPSCSAPDTGTVIVRYAHGNQLVLGWSWRGRGSGMDDVIGPKGFFQQGPGPLKPPTSAKGKFGYHCLTDLTGTSRLIRFKIGEQNMYYEQARHFLSCAQGKARCLSPAREAIKSVAIGEAILRGARDMQAKNVAW